MDDADILTSSELTLTTCKLCTEENTCLSTSSEVGRKLRLCFMAHDVARMKKGATTHRTFPVCVTCIVFLTTTSDFIRTCTMKQKTVGKKIAKFYDNKPCKEIWDFSETEPLPHLKYAPCQLCAKWNASILAFSEFGRSLKIPLKIEKVLGIELRPNAKHSPPVCLNCMVRLNNITHHQKIIRKGLKKLHEKDANTFEISVPEAREEPPVAAAAEANQEHQSEGQKDNKNVKSVPRASPNTQPEPEPEAPPITSPLPNPPSSIGDGSSSPASDNSELSSEKKERKTICIRCKKWISRSLMEDHEKMHKEILEVHID